MPDNLYGKLCTKIGRPFKLQQYWGPRASCRVGEWIVDATLAILKDPELAPDLCFTYLPTLDYDLQRTNPSNSRASVAALSRLQQQLSKLIQGAKMQAYEVVLFGDYHMVPVSGAILPNLALRQAGMMKVRIVKGMMYPDYYASRAFAVVDHEIAHVYITNKGDIPVVQNVLADLPGVAEILDRNAQAQIGLNHENSGELVIVAEEGKWLAYPWWTERSDAPDFAGHVDIHNKPGFDPCELFFGWPPGSVSQNTARIRGSHGRTGPGRDVTWAATFAIPNDPTNLVELSTSVQNWLEQGTK
jgi:predicted AlkP superfamily pyrophosphatase or phosphodiesterase